MSAGQVCVFMQRHAVVANLKNLSISYSTALRYVWILDA